MLHLAVVNDFGSYFLYSELRTQQKFVIWSRSRVRRLILEEASKSDTAAIVTDPQCGILLSGVPSVQR